MSPRLLLLTPRESKDISLKVLEERDETALLSRMSLPILAIQLARISIIILLLFFQVKVILPLRAARLALAVVVVVSTRPRPIQERQLAAKLAPQLAEEGDNRARGGGMCLGVDSIAVVAVVELPFYIAAISMAWPVCTSAEC